MSLAQHENGLQPGTIKLRKRLAEAFESQSRDDEWGAGKEADIKAFFAQHPAAKDSVLSGVECRGSLCRMQVAHADDDAIERFLAAAGMVAPLNTAGARFPDGSAGSEMYLARKGVGLPMPKDTPAEDPAKRASGIVAGEEQ